MARRRKNRRRSQGMESSDSRDAFESIDILPHGILPESERKIAYESIGERPEKAIRVRVQSAMGNAVGGGIPFPTEQVPWYQPGQFTPETSQPGRYLQHAAGEFFIQDAGSMLALNLLDPQPPEIILDLCAAPGGKATGILENVGPGTGFLVANEPVRNRVPSLSWTLSRVGFPRYVISQFDPEQLADRLTGQFDAVLVDAPCTGQTLVGRGKQKLASFAKSQVEHSASRQKRIVDEAAKLVRPGGRLVYSTCTFAAEENEAIASHLLDSEGDWSIHEREELRQWRSPIEPGGYRLWPHRDRCAGAYAVRFDKGDSERVVLDTRVARGTRFTGWKDLPLDVSDIGSLEGNRCWQSSQRWFALPEDAPEWAADIAWEGPEVAYQPSKVWLPSHRLALRRDAGWNPVYTSELADDEAQQYFMGHTLEPREAVWSVAQWRGHPLGWLKSNEMRANNSLPTAGRFPFSLKIR